MAAPRELFRLQVPHAAFDLGTAICSYGYLYLPPSIWRPATQTLERPLHYGQGQRVVVVRVSQPAPADPHTTAAVVVEAIGGTHPDGAAHLEELRLSVARMLRLDEDFGSWERTAPQWAKARGLGRTYRSPTLWEDMVKSICNTNIRFRVKADKDESGTRGFSTYGFNWRLCNLLGTAHGAFPTPAQVHAAGLPRIEGLKLGYRAPRIFHLARNIVAGDFDVAAVSSVAARLNALNCSLVAAGGEAGDASGASAASTGDAAGAADAETPAQLRAELGKAIGAQKGFGEFCTENAMQLLGVYDALPLDSETERLWTLLDQAHPKGDHPFWGSEQRSIFRAWRRKRGARAALLREAKAFYLRRHGAFAWQVYWFTLWVCVYEKHRGRRSKYWATFDEDEIASPPPADDQSPQPASAPPSAPSTPAKRGSVAARKGRPAAPAKPRKRKRRPRDDGGDAGVVGAEVAGGGRGGTVTRGERQRRRLAAEIDGLA